MTANIVEVSAPQLTATSVEDARSLIESSAPPVRLTRVALNRACGRVLGETLVATSDQPPYACAAMDGYAIVKPVDPGAWSNTFKVIGQSRAGHAYGGQVQPGEAVRIFTGAPLPAGATTIVLQELATAASDDVKFDETAATDKTHVRLRGEEFRAGAELLLKGERMTPWKVALAASSGRASVIVSVAPTVAIVTIGDELAAGGQPVKADQKYEATSIALRDMAIGWGARARLYRTISDDIGEIRDLLVSISADLIVTVGGASVGDFDLVKPALKSIGFQPMIHRINVKPGRPTFFGKLPSGGLVLGLPGSPGATLVMAQLLLRPFLRAAAGQSGEETHYAQILHPMPQGSERETYLRGRSVARECEGYFVEVMAQQDSATLLSFAQSDVLIKRPACAATARAGEWVTILPLR